MANFPQGYTTMWHPMPSGLGPEGNRAFMELHNQGYTVVAGVAHDDVPGITKMAGQLGIREYCPRDETAARFADTEAMEVWLHKGDDTLGEYGRGVFLLQRRLALGSYMLAGYGWTGPELSEQVPGGTTTFAVRIGEDDAGRGLAAPFTRVIVAASALMYEARDFWLETWKSNHAGKAYAKAGWEKLDIEIPKKRPSVKEGGEVDDIRTFWRFPNENLPKAA